jgi:hypothetical protein
MVGSRLYVSIRTGAGVRGEGGRCGYGAGAELGNIHGVSLECVCVYKKCFPHLFLLSRVARDQLVAARGEEGRGKEGGRGGREGGGGAMQIPKTPLPAGMIDTVRCRGRKFQKVGQMFIREHSI